MERRKFESFDDYNQLDDIIFDFIELLSDKCFDNYDETHDYFTFDVTNNKDGKKIYVKASSHKMIKDFVAIDNLCSILESLNISYTRRKVDVESEKGVGSNITDPDLLDRRMFIDYSDISKYFDKDKDVECEKLFFNVFKSDYEILKNYNFSKEFINTLDDKHKNLFISLNGMNKFNLFEDGAALAGAISGMGPVVTASPGSVPGAAYTGNGTVGSGDIGVSLFKPSEINDINNIKKKKKNKNKKSKSKSKKESLEFLTLFEFYTEPDEEDKINYLVSSDAIRNLSSKVLNDIKKQDQEKYATYDKHDVAWLIVNYIRENPEMYNKLGMIDLDFVKKNILK